MATRVLDIAGSRVLLWLMLLWAVALVGCANKRKPAQPAAGRPHVKVMTYNVNYGLAGDDDTAEAIREGWADIVLLQETNEGWEQDLSRRYSGSYPHMAFKHCCLAGGLGIMSKFPFEQKEYIEAEAGWFPAWRLIVDSPIGKLQLLNVHLRPPVSESGSVVSGYFSTPPIRLAEIERFHGYLDPALPTVVAGDFNENSGGRALVYLAERGLRTGLPQFEGPQDTWRWNTSVGEISSQLDHIVYDARLEPLDVHVVPLGNSDHLPVLGIFELKRKGHTGGDGKR